MSYDIRNIKNINHLIMYFSKVLNWNIDTDSFDDIDDISYDFSASDLGLKEEAFARIKSIKQLPPMVDGQKWGIFCIEFDSKRFEVTALRKVLSGLVPSRRNSADHAVWSKEDLLFLCFWGEDNNRTIGVAHFEDKKYGLPQIKMTYCAPAIEDTIHIQDFVLKIGNLAWPIEVYNYQKWHDDWSKAFVTSYKQVIHDSQTLTMQLAKEAINIRDRILETLNVETDNGYVHQLYNKFKETLIHDMSEKDFADMYAQTVVYGLFSARCMDESQENFSASEAVECLPNTNPFLKSLMKECLGDRENSKLSFDELEIGNVVDLLMHTNTVEIIKDFNRQTGGGKEDPVIHFYEEFLDAYDKSQKIQRGVYYTPQPVVNFIVRAVDTIIKNEFGFENGLASLETKRIKYKRQSKYLVDGYHYKEVEDTKEVPAIQILDPATGTGTFIRQIILQIYSNFKEMNADLDSEEFLNLWNQYVPTHLLPRLNAFELMMAPYAVAHMKLALVLKDTGYNFESKERLRVYLTNSLERPGISDKQISMFDDPLAFESVSANAVKKNDGINVIIGNPPYNNSSVNTNDWILDLISTYKEGLNEKKINLDEDSIKFIRLGQYYAEKNKNAILAYISNNSFTNGVTHRRMRYELMKAFDRIYILNLHGDSNRQEKCPDGSKDDNVFDIQQGVSINIFIRNENNKTDLATVYYSDLYGLQNQKLSFLEKTAFRDVEWSEISPTSPYYFFDNKDYLADEYETGFSVSDLFVEKNTGIETQRDSVVISFTPDRVESIIQDFSTLSEEEIRSKYQLSPDGRDWKISCAKKDLKDNNPQIIPILFRPFDVRYTAYTGKTKGFMAYPRDITMRNMLSGFRNYALLLGRQNKSDNIDSFLVTDLVSEKKSAERTIQSYLFPVFVAEMDIANNQFIPKANMNPDIIAEISNRINLVFDYYAYNSEEGFTALDVFDYIYAFLYAPSYRSKYKNQLKIAFPKIPFPSNQSSFQRIAGLGAELRELHLMHNPIDTSDVDCDVCESLEVAVPKYNNGRITINQSGTSFHYVPEEIWNMGIGGYVPLQKWLKDRKGKTLTNEEINHYKDTIERLKLTKILMVRIDDAVRDYLQ